MAQHRESHSDGEDSLATGMPDYPTIAQTARGLAPRAWYLLVGAATCLAAAMMAQDVTARLTTGVAGVTLLVLAAILAASRGWHDRQILRDEMRLFKLVGEDAAPAFTTDRMGEIHLRNKAAEERFAGTLATTLIATLSDQFASPAAVMFRLQSRAEQRGAAREDVVTRRGHLRLSVTHVSQGRFLWRLEEFQDRTGVGRGAESLSLPMMVANKAGVVLFSNEAMRRLIGSRPKRLDRVFVAPVVRNGEEVEVSTANGPVRAILSEIEGAGERREIFLFPVPAERADDSVLAEFEHLPVALMKFARDGTLTAANKAARDLVALEPGNPAMFHDLFEGLGRPVGDWLADVVDARIPTASEVLQASAADKRYLQVTLRRMVIHGKPGALVVLADATALKELEAQFIQSQKMQAIGQLAGGVAHDFNNLLTAISGHCDLLLLRRSRTDTDFADLVQIQQNANRAGALVGQLLAYSRKQTLKPERVDLHDVLSDLTHLLNRLVGERVALNLMQDPLLGPIRADKRQLEQVMMNLVVNARDAMPDGGTIRIETEAVTLAEDMRRDRAVVPAGEYAVIRVVDTGMGIPADKLQKIFEPFFTTKRSGEGTGLGLSTAYGIVKQSGGYIFVDSAFGEGSTFSIYFPVHEITADDIAPPPAPRKVVMTQGEGVVLLVEDEAPVRAFASRALRMRGYTVLEAACAEDALRLLEDPTLQVDIFVTDVVMPGMDGPSWVREALKERPDVRVIFVSGYAEDCLSEGQARIPNSVFLPKPFSLTDLTTTVQGQLH
jgi:two-component system, cell cycle sensor histidine kinase and response regulator CckA